MGTNNVVFLEVIEWFDETGRELVHRIPEGGSGEIKYGAQLTVRESQAGVFFYQGRAVEAFGPGRHTLKTANIPILTKIASIPWGLSSPLRAEVYFVNLKIFTNLKWGTRDPVAFKDSELGLIRLRAFGVFNVQVVQPVLFINSLVGTQGMMSTEAVEGYLNRVIVSRFNDYMGETMDSILDLPAKYDELSEGLAKRLQEDFSRFGLALSGLYVNAITPPPEVQAAIDDRARMGVFKDMNKLMQMKAAMAMEKASEAGSESGQGMGLGMGLMMPAMFAQYFAGARPHTPNGGDETPGSLCPDCKHPVPVDARFCPSCGHQLLVFKKCASCGKNLTPNARFCPRCGKPVEDTPGTVNCPKCGSENLRGAHFCNQCGERL
ncbi:MAG: SPFH domain-containing protein [Deltaproteobacteria bacterium]|nr:SPFH domain-containing protein [Deltaproteobacteria bacterium]MBW2017400.1 SPFH domain-containing protein [Deltaproteobacteria bacterium]MBW2130208.1 SPFH domain-containing protein [Deltaproteobacteria bacterium]MBW2302961.1 SPFH domain-containing protein [Deltaproteobacteria bacterium]